MDKSGFERGDNGHKLLDRQAVLGLSGIERRERLRNHLARELAQRHRAGARGEDEELPVVETLAPHIVIHVGIKVERVHCIVLSQPLTTVSRGWSTISGKGPPCLRFNTPVAIRVAT